ncbi:MAG: isoleucine--tRNA ligase [Bacteroidia bacterium]|nr:isoleucine--tRNA ligase [Bacteroidia bacterium]
MYRTQKNINWPALEETILQEWKQRDIFNKSIENRPENNPFVFYEGPPSANGMPGIHHVMSRAIKDVFCRFKTLQGFRVERKGGWDTHGLPIELQVEKRLGITKEDIGKSISVEDYNKECRTDVMKFKDTWDNLTERIGYWVDLNNPYVTYENDYIETLWYLLKELYKKDFLYKGYTIQPYSPAAGTGLSSHELNQPDTYKMVRDTTVVAQFRLTQEAQQNLLPESEKDAFFIAWTTTPWTLPSNTALAVGKNITYIAVETFNQYTFKPVIVILAKELFSKYFNEKASEISLEDYKEGDKLIPFKILKEIKGSNLADLRYEQLMPFNSNKKELIEGDAFKVVTGDFVTTEDGTGIVHIAPSFGADDFRVSKQNGIGALTLVDKQGRFIEGTGDYAGLYVKNYNNADESAPDYKSTDVLISIRLKEENKAFKVEKYEHTYPHCWRTDKPILYYPLESWFIKTTAVKERMVELNKTINWKPKSTGEGRFGNWLENLVDWNLSRSRYWGTPLPIWRTDDGTEEICIGSIEELKAEITKAEAAGIKQDINTDVEIDLHKPYVDGIILISKSGKPMKREADLIDVWFDSGAMPYAQWGLKNKDSWNKTFPADFIAEGVDQTRGWFFTLHAIAVMLFDSVAYKNVLANGLVLDKNGNKMSKRLGNTIDPFITIDKFGADAVRWYMLSNASPWDNLKFDLDGVAEVQRKFFGTLANTYSFFALYANIDNFELDPENISDISTRSELDKWIISKLNSLISEVTDSFNDYDPTKASRAIEEFTDSHLSNWYVRLSRRRFWKGEMSSDKKAAYETLYECLKTISQLMSPVAPFFSDWLYQSLTEGEKTGSWKKESVHLTNFPTVEKNSIDINLEQTMQIAQDLVSLVLSLRKKHSIKVRQPLQKIMVPVLNKTFEEQLKHVEHLILSELNIKELEYLDSQNNVLVKKIKPNFKTLGKKAGASMKALSDIVSTFNQEQIRHIEQLGNLNIQLNGSDFELLLEDVEISFMDIPGWLVATNNTLTVALDANLTEELKNEGLAREFVNRLQNIRKEKDFNVTDKIIVSVLAEQKVNEALNAYKAYICSEILAADIYFTDNQQDMEEIDLEGMNCKVSVSKN